MQAQTSQHTSNEADAFSTACEHQQPTLFTVKQFSAKQQAFTEPALRNLIFKAETRQSSKGEIPGNGLIECGAIIRVGRKVIIDDAKFLNWVRLQNGVKS